VEEIVESFGQAARRAREADFSLVEVLVGTGYLISQFLSPITNQRADRYGGDLYGRMTFLREILAAVRSYAGADFPITCRISGDEFMPGGNTITEITELVKFLEREKVDMVSVCAGWHESLVTPVTAEVPPGAYAYFTRTFKEHVAIPLAISNRINNPAVAEEILSLGHADAIVMARALIADPLFVQKAKEGREEFIRPCVACNQGCLDHLFMGIPSVCMVNARTGHETEPSPEERPLEKRVLVVGAGPAGMEAARVAAVRGARVILADAHPYLGGQVILAGTPPNRKPFLELLRYYQNELQRLNVDIRLRETITSESPLLSEADAVILATGGQPMIPPIPGVASPQVMTAWEVLEGKKKAFGNVVIVGGGATGCETAIYLASKSEIPPAAADFLKRRDITPPLPRNNPKITIVEMLKRIGSDIGVTTRWVVLQELAMLGIQTMTQVEVTAIEPEGIVYRNETGNLCRLPADSVILATGVYSVNPLEAAWSGKKTLHVIGDASKPRKVLDAIEEGYRAAMALV
jgi:2,4-dienoyl-CoA reductase (NADPH2)